MRIEACIPKHQDRDDNTMRIAKHALVAAALIGLCLTTDARADEANAARAKQILKSMSDYIGAQKTVTAKFEADLQAITQSLEKVLFSSSGHLVLSRPDKIRVSRTGGYSDVELTFDGKTATVYSKPSKAFARLDLPGSVDNLIDVLQGKYGVVMPGGDLLLTNTYDDLIAGVLEAKYIGHGVVDGVECEHLAFRNFDTDWQLWVELGANPVPHKYVITSKTVTAAPEYTLRIKEWKASESPAADAFAFKAPDGVKEVALEALTDIDELPSSTSPQAGK